MVKSQSRLLSSKSDQGPKDPKPIMPRVQYNQDFKTGHQQAFAYEAVLEEVRDDIQNVTGWGIGQFRINGNKVSGPILLTKKLAFKWNLGTDSPTVKDLKIEDFELLTVMKPSVDLIILGTGNSIVHPDPKLLKQLRDIAPVEILDSVNAGATFNLLSKEDRQVAAALLPVLESR